MTALNERGPMVAPTATAEAKANKPSRSLSPGKRLDALLSIGDLMGEMHVSRRTAEAIMENLDKVVVPGVQKAFVKRDDVHAYIAANTVRADPRRRAA